MSDQNDLALPLTCLLVAALGVGVFLLGGPDEPVPSPTPAPLVKPQPAPTPQPTPQPTPPPKPQPKPGPCPRTAGDAGCQPVGLGGKCGCCYGCQCSDSSCPCRTGRYHCGAFACRCGSCVGAAVDGEEHAGTEILCPLPPDFHTKNVGGSDGAGLCVFCSMHHSGIWCDEPVFAAIFDWMKKHPGGGYPEKVTKMVKQCAQELNLPEPEYIQVTGKDLEVLKEACKQGRMPGVTYGFSPSGRYGGRHISHMVSLVHADNNWFVILDNNYVTGDKHLEWLTPEEFSKVYGSGWAVIPLKSGPPYPPQN